ncbi:Disease resistance protein TAO1 [Linum perenne]
MAESGHLVLPIFYKVQPSDVTDASGSYATTISRKFESDEDAKRWLDALKDVANCVGHTSQAIQIESELIKTIVEDVQKQLIDMSPPVVSSNLVGMSSRILKMEKLLAIDTLDDTRIIGLWGMGGVGKTTLAKACYERIASSKKGKIKCHFVRNINGVCPQLVNLMVLQFSYCKNLTAIPDISRSSKLEELLLKDCSSLVELPSHVQYLTKLIKLKLRHCKNLKRLPNVLDSKLLKFVWISYCPNVAHTAMTEMNVCDQYHHQASCELTLPRFVKVRLFGNAQLERLPKSIWNMVSGALVVQGSPLLESLPEVSEPINGLTCVSITECDSLKTVPSSINNIKSLKSLDLSKTDIKSLPSSIQELVHLTRLDLGYCKSLESIPSTIQKLVELSRLYLTGCSSIRYLPQLPSKLKKLDVSGCKSLQALPSNTAKLLRLESLRFDDCPQLDPSLPDEIVTNFPGRMISSPLSWCKLLCSGSELPKWFVYQGMKNMNEEQNEDCTVKLKLPLPELMISVKGMAFGVVCSWDTCNSWPIMKCDCEIDDGTIVASWSSNYWSLNGGENSSDCLLMWFDTNLSGKTMEVRDEAWNLKYAGLTVSFRFHPTVLSPRPKNLRITRCGVSLMFG